MSLSPVECLWRATAALHATGVPLMARVLPHDCKPEAWRHYPETDVVNGAKALRYYYHSHAPGERGVDEHGHFHVFIGRGAFSRRQKPLVASPDARRPRPALVHIAALSIDHDGLPISWFAPNRWVTDEWLYPADVVAAQAVDLSFAGEQGDALVNDWLGAMLRASHSEIRTLLKLRDAALATCDAEDRAREVLARLPIDLDALLQG